MNRYDFFFELLVTEAQMDQSFAWAEAADWLAMKTAILGKVSGSTAKGSIHWGATVTENAAPDMNVVVAAGASSDPTGRYVGWGSNQLVDCTVDYLAASTDVVSPGNERYIGVFALWERNLTNAVQDGNGLTVYFEQYDSFELQVHQGVEASAGNAVAPATPADSIRLTNILLSYGDTSILNAYIDDNIVGRLRDDWVRVLGTNFPNFVYGNPADAIANLFGKVDAISSSSSVAFTGSGDWHDGSGALSSTDVEAAINEIPADLSEDNAGAGGEWGSDKIGSDEHSTVGSYADLTRGSVSDQLIELADYIAGHINGGAPAHAAASVVFTPVGFISSTDTQAAIAEMITDFAGDATGGADGSTKIGHFDSSAGTEETTVHDKLDGLQSGKLDKSDLDFASGQLMFGDTIVAPSAQVGNLRSIQYFSHGWPEEDYGAESHAYPYRGHNLKNYGDYEIIDVALFAYDRADGLGSRLFPIYAMSKAATGDARLVMLDPLNFSAGTEVIDTIIDADSQICSICVDGDRVYAMMINDSGTTNQKLRAFEISAGNFAEITSDSWPYSFPNDSLKIGSDRWFNNCIVIGNKVFCSAANVDTTGIPFYLINSDGTLDSSGKGGHTSLATKYPTGALAYDGTDLYSVTYDTVIDDCYVASHLISNIVNQGVNTFSSPASDEGRIHQLIFDGQALWWGIYHTSGTLLRLGKINDPAGTPDEQYTQVLLTLSDGPGASGEFHPVWLAFDGLNLWCTREQDSTIDKLLIDKFDASYINDTDRQPTAAEKSILFWNAHDVTASLPPKIISDGMNLYAADSIQGSSGVMVPRISTR